MLCSCHAMHSVRLTGAHAMQVLKIAFPVYYGSRYQCEKVPQHRLIMAVQTNKVQISSIAEAKAAMPAGKIHQ